MDDSLMMNCEIRGGIKNLFFCADIHIRFVFYSEYIVRGICMVRMESLI